MRIKVLHDTVLIQPDPYVTDLKLDKIVLPEENTVEKRSPFATVVLVGSKCKHGIKPGDRVIINTQIGWGKESDYYEGDKRYRFIRESYILGVCHD